MRARPVTDEVPAQAGHRWATRLRFAVLLALTLAIAVLIALVIIGLFYDSGDESADSAAGGLNVGPANEYEPGDVNQFDRDHFFLVRYPDGSFDAFYDKSARQQELNGTCRIFYDDTATVGTLEQIQGMRGAFVEACDDERSVWRVDGTFSFGNSYGDLDRFETRVDSDGDLFVDTSERTCTRSVGVPGIPPFETRTCAGAP